MIRLLLAVACLFAEQAYAESTDKVDASSHWAFQPILSPKLPPTRTKDWVKNEIDAFILHRLEKSGITPPERASGKALRRRLHYALIGLPPRNLEPVPDLNKEIERLLESPHYGEKWGRHWLGVSAAMPILTDWMKIWPMLMHGVTGMRLRTVSMQAFLSTISSSSRLQEIFWPKGSS